MRVVTETLEYALTFRNLSGVYIYAVLVTGFPLFLVLLVKLSVGSPLFARAWRRLVRLLPLNDKPFRFLGITLAGFASISGVVASVMFHTVGDLFQI